jgi:hypothetical protein
VNGKKKKKKKTHLQGIVKKTEVLRSNNHNLLGQSPIGLDEVDVL